MDIVKSSTRSRMMAAVKQKNTLPELLVRHYLYSLGFRYRIHVAKLPGTPDIVLKKYRVVIFVHGCFWHRHPNCANTTTPKSNSLLWHEKFTKNIARDQQNIRLLREAGWNVIVIWTCGVKPKRLNFEWLDDAVRHPQSQFIEWPAASGVDGN